jgi:hypothetical protein
VHRAAELQTSSDVSCLMASAHGPFFCEFCRKKRCNRRSRIPVGPKNRRRWVQVCAWCSHHNMQKVREWIARLELEIGS